MFYFNFVWRHITTFGWIAFFAVCLTACSSNERYTKLYPVDSLLTKQVNTLTALKATLTKQAVISQKSDSKKYTPADTLAWITELEIFRQLDVINKPVSRSSYLVNDGLYDPGSNLTVKAFTDTTDDLPVKYLRVYYDRSVFAPRKIEAYYKDENSLYQSSRLLLLEFQQINNTPVLTSYAIEGGQKMILSDTVTFSVKGKITIN
jgi:hypothetical protein